MAPTNALKPSGAWKNQPSVPSGDANAGSIAHLKEMGFAESECRKALAECVWDVNRALDLLVSRGACALAPLPKSEVRGNDSSDLGNKSRDDNSTTASSVSTPRTNTNLAAESGQVAETTETTVESKEASQKPIRRVCNRVNGEGAGLLSAEVDDFVRVWPHSQTELGWIYAEDPIDASRAGWLPSVVLDQVEEEHHAWLLVHKTMEATQPNQLDVKFGQVLKVNLKSRTPEGWAYAYAVSGTSSKTNAAGWVPVISLCWEDDNEPKE